MNVNKTRADMVEAIQTSLKFIRPLIGLSVQGIAEHIGVTRQTINNLESNKSKMTVTQYISICAVIDSKCKENNDILRKIKQTITENSGLNLDIGSNESFLEAWFSTFSNRGATDGEQVCELTLLATTKSNTSNIIGKSTVKGEVPAASGLNWGYSSGVTLLEDAYIPINRGDIKKAGEMFIKSSNVNIPITAIWDDGTKMKLLLEGVRFNSGDNNIYPKQISSYQNKSNLGNYLRKRIGNKIGKNLEYSENTINIVADIKSRNNRNKEGIIEEIQNNNALLKELNDKFITLNYLEQYGRTTVSVKLEDGIYELDFSV